MKLKIFCRCSLFPSWSGYGLIGTPCTNIYQRPAAGTGQDSETVPFTFQSLYLIFHIFFLCYRPISYSKMNTFQ